MTGFAVLVRHRALPSRRTAWNFSSSLLCSASPSFSHCQFFHIFDPFQKHSLKIWHRYDRPFLSIAHLSFHLVTCHLQSSSSLQIGLLCFPNGPSVRSRRLLISLLAFLFAYRLGHSLLCLSLSLLFIIPFQLRRDLKVH